EIYSCRRAEWTRQWRDCLQEVLGGEFLGALAILHLHAHTPLIGGNLVEAVRELAPRVRVLFSYHTPVSCPKGTLYYFNRERCTHPPERRLCTACFVHGRLGLPEGMARLAASVWPAFRQAALPTLLQQSGLVQASIEGFRALAEEIDGWMVFSEQIRQTLERVGIPSERIFLQRHGIHDFYAEPLEDGRRQGEQVFVYLGRFNRVKGVHTLLRAWLELEARPGRRLWLLGNPQEGETHLEPLLEAAARRSDIEFLGTRPPEEIRQLLHRAHCVVVPSEWVEIGPLVIHEGLACGANILASDIGGNAELCSHYGAGCRTFPPGDVQALRRCIEAFRYEPVRPRVRTQSEHYTRLLEHYRSFLAPTTPQTALP
ncbi:MAG: glycosyltransferase, partial [Bacteroidetes bacterium]